MPKFTLSIVVYNNAELTRRCIDSIMRTIPSDYEIIVTDNASTDTTAAYLDKMTKLSPAIKVVKNATNLGFNAPNNHALTLAGGKYFVVLNNDIEFQTAGWLGIMEAEFTKNPKLAICGLKGGCNDLNADGVGFGGPKLEYVEGSCLMIPTALARQHGLFSDYLKFAYFEDSDLSLRMRERGYDIVLVPVSRIHHGAATSKIVRGVVDLDGYHQRNKIIFKTRWARYLQKRTFKKFILITRRGAMGDVLLVTPVIRTLKKKFPLSEIIFRTGFPEMLARNPYVTRTEVGAGGSTDNAYEERYNLDLAYEKRPTMHVVDAYAEECGIKVDNYFPDIFPSIDEERWAEAYLPKGRHFVAFHPGPTAWKGRNWTQAGFNAVIDYFRKENVFTVALGGPGGWQLKADLDLRGRTTVHSLYALLKRAALFVGIDSMPMHIAIAANIPVVAVFGCISPEYRLPPGLGYMRGAMANVGCLGCHHYLPAPRVTSDCFRERVFCMDNLKPETVIEEIKKALKIYMDMGAKPRV